MSHLTYLQKHQIGEILPDNERRNFSPAAYRTISISPKVFANSHWFAGMPPAFENALPLGSAPPVLRRFIRHSHIPRCKRHPLSRFSISEIQAVGCQNCGTSLPDSKSASGHTPVLESCEGVLTNETVRPQTPSSQGSQSGQWTMSPQSDRVSTN